MGAVVRPYGLNTTRRRSRWKVLRDQTARKQPERSDRVEIAVDMRAGRASRVSPVVLEIAKSPPGPDPSKKFRQCILTQNSLGNTPVRSESPFAKNFFSDRTNREIALFLEGPTRGWCVWRCAAGSWPSGTTPTTYPRTTQTQDTQNTVVVDT